MAGHFLRGFRASGVFRCCLGHLRVRALDFGLKEVSGIGLCKDLEACHKLYLSAACFQPFSGPTNNYIQPE